MVWLWPHCVFSNEPSNYLFEKMTCWLQLSVFSPLCIWKCILKWLTWEVAQSHWSDLLRFFSVGFQMSPQMASSRGCIVTLIAFIWLVSTVGFHMFPQIGWIMACKVTLVVSVWFFSTVSFQMYPQSACIKGCIVTLVAFVALFFTVCFQTFPEIACQRGCIVTLVAFVRLFPTVYHQMSS